MENKKEKIADFKTAISSTVRSLSNSEKIEVSFGNESSKSSTNSIRLPELSPINNKLNYNQIRAIADSKSLRHRFSDSKTYKKYEPDGNISKQLYKIAEKIRCEKIGSSYFKGIKNNIETFYALFEQLYLSDKVFIQLFDLNKLLINITKHELVPSMRIVSEEEKLAVKEKYNVESMSNFPSYLVMIQ